MTTTVEMKGWGCGGSLVAPDIVLFAATCGDLTNGQVNIGAYETRSTTGDSQARFCEKWIPDPTYDVNTFAGDFALCKLDSPVDINKDTVRLELNQESTVPEDDADLLIMGLGLMGLNLDKAHFLQHSTVQYVADELCNSDSYDWYLIPEEQFCAVTPGNDGGTCYKDDGGPVVKRTVNEDGTFVDTQVGIIISNYYTFGDCIIKPNFPAVYSRVSSRFDDWIKPTICDDLQGHASFCENPPTPPTPIECDDEEETELTISVTTDAEADQKLWDLKWTLWTDVPGSDDVVITTRQYLVNNLQNVHKICLKRSECYSWQIKDAEYEKGLGSYTLALNGQEFASGDRDSLFFGYGKLQQFCANFEPTVTPSASPTVAPSPTPTWAPTAAPSTDPTLTPTWAPTATPTVAPTPTQACNKHHSTFQIEIREDRDASHTTIATFSLNNDYTELDDLVYLKHDFQSDERQNINLCLEADRCFLFAIYDAMPRDYFDLFLEGRKIYGGRGEFGYYDSRIFCTGDHICRDNRRIRFTKKKLNCKKFVKGKLGQRKKKCNRFAEGDFVYNHCPETCGKKASVGPCSWMRNKAEEMEQFVLREV
jgi:hypothetical protein